MTSFTTVVLIGLVVALQVADPETVSWQAVKGLFDVTVQEILGLEKFPVSTRSFTGHQNQGTGLPAFSAGYIPRPLLCNVAQWDS